MKAKLLICVGILILTIFGAGKNYACNQDPVASLSADPEIVCVDQTVTLDGSGSSDPDGGNGNLINGIKMFEWDIDWDGKPPHFSPEYTESPGDGIITHAYEIAGTYTVRLRVTDNDAAEGGPPDKTDYDTCTVIVTEPGSLVLKDLKSGNVKIDQAAEGPPPPSTLYVAAAADGKGDIKFWIVCPDGEATYNWQIVGTERSDTLTSDNSYSRQEEDLDPGEYTLEVTKIDYERKIDFTVIDVTLVQFYYFRPTSGDPDHSDEVYTPIVKRTDKLYFSFKTRILPSSGLSGVEYEKAKVVLASGSSELSSEEHTFSGSHYPDVTMVGNVTDNNIEPLTIPDTVSDLSLYTFRSDMYVTAGDQVLEFKGVDSKSVETHYKAVEVGQTISGEDNLSGDVGRAEVKDTILNRWNFPVIANGHAFAKSTLTDGNTSIYLMALDSDIFECWEPPPPLLDDTVQHARQLGKDILANPGAADGNGPIYFYESGSSYDIVDDLVAVGLLYNCATYGNKYFAPTSNPNNWTTETIRDGYDADPGDSLIW